VEYRLSIKEKIGKERTPMMLPPVVPVKSNDSFMPRIRNKQVKSSSHSYSKRYRQVSGLVEEEEKQERLARPMVVIHDFETSLESAVL
jgi:hypothetical protein